MRGLVLVLVGGLFVAGNGGVRQNSRPESFTFGASGDLGGPGSAPQISLGNALAKSGAAFFLALGDLGYSSDERGWCTSIKSRFTHVEIIVGNHDTLENGPGRIANFVKYCPFTLRGIEVHGGPGTPGYGYEYYFDYPAVKPTTRFILIAPGIQGELSYSFRRGSSHYQFAADAIDAARRAGIPWVIAAMHKNCVTTGLAYPNCETGPDIQNLFLEKRVDLVLNAHDHNYQRSKQLRCFGMPAFRPSCIAGEGPTYTKGEGTVFITQGAGHDFYPLARPLNGYYAAGQDRETGFVQYAITATSISARFVSTSGAYSDRFAITAERPKTP
jgi:hypothetical protein